MRGFGAVTTLGLIIAMLLQSCSIGFKEHTSGVVYKFIEENSLEISPKEKDIVTIEMTCVSKAGIRVDDTGIFRTQVRPAKENIPSIEHVLLMMHKGDSIVFKIKAETYFTEAKNTRVPEKIAPEELLTFNLKLHDVMALDDFKRERTVVKMSGEQQEEKLLMDYLKRTNVTVDPTISGLYHVVLKEGNGENPVPGKKVKVHYMGFFIDGRKFDASYDHGGPFEFRLGRREVIAGWDEGVSRMTKGEKARFIVPSHLGYGSAKSGPVPAYSTLVFEIELLDFEK
jgi:FKBP-type peptidyl-prolyl cis-trans isomerase